MCVQAKTGIHVAHANKVRSLAKSQGLLAKTDQLDACVLSEYGFLMQVKPDALLLSKNAENMKILLNRRHQLIKEKLAEQKRLANLADGVIKKIPAFLYRDISAAPFCVIIRK